MRNLRRQSALLAVLLGLALSASATAQEVERLPLLGSKFPIAAAVTVRAGTDTVFLSGALGPTVDPNAPPGTPPSWGDTEAQTVQAITRLKSTLARLGMGLGDVVKMNVFLVGDPQKGGHMDFAGFMAGYTQFFGTPSQPHLPARSAVQVVALAETAALVEIEVVAAEPR
jgi:enamine deaminase RidA (YjgF/YER057c/UK114 family)